MFDIFRLQQGGSQYCRLIASLQRVFGATLFFGTYMQREKATVMHDARFNFMRQARIWYLRDSNQTALPGGFENALDALSLRLSGLHIGVFISEEVRAVSLIACLKKDREFPMV